jgi:uncharacterized phage-associated protein
MVSPTETAIDVAFWFSDHALNQNEYLQPQKLQRLLFLAQAYYAVAYEGRTLMPAVFVADDMGPIEPNVYKIFSKGRPDIDPDLFLPMEVEEFLDAVWRRFGHHSAEHLTRLTKRTKAYQSAFKKGRRTEISLDAMRLSFVRSAETPDVDNVVKPKMMRSQDGKAVEVKSWVPGTGNPVRK